MLKEDNNTFYFHFLNGGLNPYFNGTCSKSSDDTDVYMPLGH